MKPSEILPVLPVAKSRAPACHRHLGQDRIRILGESPASRCQPHAARKALQKIDADFFFQLPDLTRQCRLRNAEDL